MRVLAICLGVLVIPCVVSSTPYVPPQEGFAVPYREDEPFLGGVPAEPFNYTYDPLDRLGMCADFITTLQVSDTTEIAYGGMREGEHMLSVIQTDNTSESIWIWTHCYRLTGQDDYHDNIDAAWEYCMNFPAYDEEGGSDLVTGYYRVYNCSWALRAEMEYEDVYGDTAYSAYADSCASYLCHNPLMLRYPTGMYRRLNGMVMGWAVGNLYEYGEVVGNAVFMSKAVDMADSLKGWVEVNPNKLHWQEWAMEGGSLMWGLANSYFREYPSGLVTWVETYGSYLATEVDSSQYQNAWRGWAALGQATASEVTGSGVHGGYFKHLADTLVLNDGDSDGGIPVIDAEPDDHDQSWVTNYLGFMCMARMIEISGLASGDALPAGNLTAQVAPVPSMELPALNFRLGQAAEVSIRIYDISGRRVAGRHIGSLTKGPHTISLAEELGSSAVSPGIYFYSLDAGTDVARGKLVVLK